MAHTTRLTKKGTWTLLPLSVREPKWATALAHTWTFKTLELDSFSLPSQLDEHALWALAVMREVECLPFLPCGTCNVRTLGMYEAVLSRCHCDVYLSQEILSCPIQSHLKMSAWLLSGFRKHFTILANLHDQPCGLARSISKSGWLLFMAVLILHWDAWCTHSNSSS